MIVFWPFLFLHQCLCVAIVFCCKIFYLSKAKTNTEYASRQQTSEKKVNKGTTTVVMDTFDKIEEGNQHFL